MHKMIKAAVFVAALFVIVEAAPRPGYYGGDEHGHSELAHEYTEITKPVVIPQYKHMIVKLPHTVPVPVPKPVVIQVAQPYPVQIHVPQPVPIPVIKTIHVPIEKQIPVPVEKKIPYPVEKLVPIKVEVPRPYKVHVPVYKHIYHHSKPHSSGKHEEVVYSSHGHGHGYEGH